MNWGSNSGGYHSIKSRYFREIEDVGFSFALIYDMETPKNAHFPMPTGFYGIRLNVDDLDAAVEAIKQSGGTVLTEPLETPYATVVAVQDVDGNYLTIMKHKRK